MAVVVRCSSNYLATTRGANYCDQRVAVCLSVRSYYNHTCKSTIFSASEKLNYVDNKSTD